MKNVSKASKILLLILISYALIGFLALPLILKDQLQKQLEEQWNISTHIESIFFNPFTFTFELNDIQTHIKKKPFFELQQLQVKFSLFKSIERGYFHFNTVQFQRPKLSLEFFEDGTSTLSFLTHKTKQEKSQSNDSVFNFKISKTLLQQAIIDIVIHKNQSPTRIYFDELNYAFYDLGTFNQALASHTLSSNINQNTQLSIKGGFRLHPFSMYGNIELQNLNIADFTHLNDTFLNAKITQGKLHTQFGYQLDFSPFKLKLNDGHFKLTHINVQQNQETLAKLAQLSVNNIHLTYPEQHISIEDIQIHTPYVFAQMSNKGQLNLNHVLKPGNNAATHSNEKPWEVTLRKLALSSGNIIFEDQQSHQNMQLNDISFSSEQIQFIKEKLTIKDTILSVNDFNFEQKAQNTQVKAQKLSLKLQQWQQHNDRIQIQSVLFKQPQTHIQNSGLEVLLKQLNLRIEQFVKKEDYLSIHAIEMKDPSINIVLKEQGPVQTKPPSNNTTSVKSNMNINVGPFHIHNATLNFEDKNLPIPFQSNITQLNGKFSQFISQSSQPTKLTLEGQVNQYGYAKITGFVNHENIKQLTDVNMIFKNIAIKDLSAYSGKFVGRAFNAGKLNLDLKYNILRYNLNAKNDIIIQDIQLGRKIKSTTAMDVPLELGIALLEDSEGKIDLKIPITGDLNNPNFSIAPLVWKALGNLIVKAVSAPFRFLASLLGIQEDKIKSIEFAFGQSALLHSEKETLDYLIEIIKKRPNLQLTVNAAYNKPQDTYALQKKKFDALIAQTMKTVQAKDVYKAALHKMYTTYYTKEQLIRLQQDTQKEKYIALLEDKIIEKQAIDLKDLEALSKQRIKNIKAYFTMKKSVFDNIIYNSTANIQSKKGVKWVSFPINISVKQ